MNIEVTKDNVTITNKEQIHKGEYLVNECNYTFSEEYEGLTCKAIFETMDNLIEVPITVGKSIIPPEILSDEQIQCKLRVYGYQTEEIEDNGETQTVFKLRYSPAYAEFELNRGSYIPDAASSEEITPSQFEQYTEALNQGLNEIQEAIGNAENLDIDVSKEGRVATITITKQDESQKSVTVSDGDTGLTAFEISNGHLIAISENPDNLTDYYISNGHLFVKIGE